MCLCLFAIFLPLPFLDLSAIVLQTVSQPFHHSFGFNLMDLFTSVLYPCLYCCSLLFFYFLFKSLLKLPVKSIFSCLVFPFTLFHFRLVRPVSSMKFLFLAVAKKSSLESAVRDKLAVNWKNMMNPQILLYALCQLQMLVQTNMNNK